MSHQREILIGQAVGEYFIYGRDPDTWTSMLYKFAEQLGESPERVDADIRGRIIANARRLQGNGEDFQPMHTPTPPSGCEFMARTFPPRRDVLGPFTTSALIHAAGDTGVGKTMVGASMSYALCEGDKLFTWNAGDPVRVLHVDGEMPGDLLQERFGLFEWSQDGLERLSVLSVPDYCTSHGLEPINLAEPTWQSRIEQLAEAVDVVQLDNFFSLVSVPGVSLASDEHYAPIRPLLIRLRAMGKLVIFWDHTNEQGRPFGTRTKGWVCDYVFTLTKDKDALTDEIAFTLAFTKTRARAKGEGRGYLPFHAKLLHDPNGRAAWLVKMVEEAQMVEAWELSKSGMKQREIAKELEVSVGKVNKLLKRARSVGLP